MDLLDLRTKIDNIDEQIIELLISRFDISKDVGNYKKQNNLPIENRKREEDILKSMHILNSEFESELQYVYEEIFKQSKRIQK